MYLGLVCWYKGRASLARAGETESVCVDYALQYKRSWWRGGDGGVFSCYDVASEVTYMSSTEGDRFFWFYDVIEKAECSNVRYPKSCFFMIIRRMHVLQRQASTYFVRKCSLMKTTTLVSGDS